LEIISSTPYVASHVESTIPRVMEGQEEVQTILEPNVVIEQGAEDVSISVRARFLDIDKQGKSSPHLGIFQKDGKKGGSKKNVKLGRKKDLERIKMIGETLVESGSVKTLDSHFSTPTK